MVRKEYDWFSGANLEDHSKIKHRIVSQYFKQYLRVRCRYPLQTKFRLGVVDGFCGGGVYSGGELGSPIIFLQQLIDFCTEINIDRSIQGISPLQVECVFIFNDKNIDAISTLKENVSLLGTELNSDKNLIVHVIYMNLDFESGYEEIKTALSKYGVNNVIFNLDQYGFNKIDRNTIFNIMNSFSSSEIIYTFNIQSLLTFLEKGNIDGVKKVLDFLRVPGEEVEILSNNKNNNEWLGAAERLVFRQFCDCARFVSPFSINNENGWRYWLIHFSNMYRARQVYNDILHVNSSDQAHFGRSGLHMLFYDYKTEANLYLFDEESKSRAENELSYDIPKFLSSHGDAMLVSDFYENAYNMTPAHSEDINNNLVGNTELEVVTRNGGVRRSGRSIRIDDVIRLKDQKTFFPMFDRNN